MSSTSPVTICGSVTKSGKPCQNILLTQMGLCPHHTYTHRNNFQDHVEPTTTLLPSQPSFPLRNAINQNNVLDASFALPNKGKCVSRTIRGKRCQNKIINPGMRCKLHASKHRVLEITTSTFRSAEEEEYLRWQLNRMEKDKSKDMLLKWAITTSSADEDDIPLSQLAFIERNRRPESVRRITATSTTSISYCVSRRKKEEQSGFPKEKSLKIVDTTRKIEYVSNVEQVSDPPPYPQYLDLPMSAAFCNIPEGPSVTIAARAKDISVELLAVLRNSSDIGDIEEYFCESDLLPPPGSENLFAVMPAPTRSSPLYPCPGVLP